MHQQHLAGRDVRQQVLRAPADAADGLPSSRSAKFFGNGKRRSGRRASTRTKRAPSITGCRPRRTVSTSGSSGMVNLGVRRYVAPARSAALWSLSCASRDPFRLPRRAARRQAGAGRRRVPQGGAALRPDERPDVGRAASRLEGRAGHGDQSARNRDRAFALLDVAGGTGDVSFRTDRGGRPRHARDRRRHQCRHARRRARARLRAGARRCR